MCGRYTLIMLADINRLFPWLSGPAPEAIHRRFNAAPSQHLPVVRDHDGKPELTMMRWGFIPSWTKDKPKLAPINAKAETVATSGMFRTAFQKRRCLVPANGFYEWKGAKPPKQPYFIHLKDKSMFTFAGLWERWRPPGSDEPVDTFTIITTEANALMKPIHNRMPVMLDADGQERWLESPDTNLLKSFPATKMEAWPVSTAVNKPTHDAPDCIEPIE